MNTKLNVDSVPSGLELMAQGAPSHNALHDLNKLSATQGSAASSQLNAPLGKKNHKRSSSMGNSFRNFSNKSGAKMPEVPDQMQIMYDGVEINTIQDLINNFKLDRYDEAMKKRELQVNDPDNPMPSSKDVDPAYWDMIQQYRPTG